MLALNDQHMDEVWSFARRDVRSLHFYSNRDIGDDLASKVAAELWNLVLNQSFRLCDYELAFDLCSNHDSGLFTNNSQMEQYRDPFTSTIPSTRWIGRFLPELAAES